MYTKSLLAGSIVGGIALIYATYNNINTEEMAEKLEENKSKFFDIIDELMTLGMEILEKIMIMITKIITEGIFRLKMLLNIA